MATRELNRDLLFGLFALQTGFIDQSALVAAFRCWVRDKSRSLATYLIDRGDLKKDQMSAIDALVTLHQNGDGRSADRGVVATLGHHDWLLSEFERSLDPDAQTVLSLLEVSAFGAPAGDLDPTATVDACDATKSYKPAATSSAGGRFRILRFHAEGALGEIYVAHDEELNRDVALKRIKNEPAHDPDCRVRFVREAEITGRLEHPCIVPVYGLGEFADGRPEYAMRFIEGESLRAAISRHHAGGSDGGVDAAALSLPNLVRRFLDVCNAISYAHNRGIVHRDIKPSNIMLGPYGETLVVDWGLAKPIGRPADAADGLEKTLRPSTRGGEGSPTVGAVGTPSYMSPEQASGAQDQVSFASDIYALGATLYCLLTGKAPFLGDSDDGLAILAKVRSGEFRKPRELKPSVPRPLEAVCLQAMALKPENRYKTARALARDIERWLADAPVSVYREPPSVRASRWVRRHKPLVSAAAVLVVCAVIALCVDVVRVGRERAVAEYNFVTAREAVNRVLTEVAEGRLAAVPQAEDLRLRIAKDASEFNERFLRQRPRDPAVIREAALTYRKLGNIQRTFNLPAEAARSYGQAIVLGERLISQFAGGMEDELNLALTLADSGEFERMRRDLPKAEQSCRSALAIADRWLQQTPRHPGCHLARAFALSKLAQVQLDLHQPEDACRSAEGAVTIYNPMTRHPVEGARNATLLLLTLNSWGKALGQSGHSEEAERRLRDAINGADSLTSYLGEPSARLQIDVPALLPSIAFARSNAEFELGFLLAPDSKRRSLATDQFERSIAELSSLVAAYPRVAAYSDLLAAAKRARDEIRAKEGSKP